MLARILLTDPLTGLRAITAVASPRGSGGFAAHDTPARPAFMPNYCHGLSPGSGADLLLPSATLARAFSNFIRDAPLPEPGRVLLSTAMTAVRGPITYQRLGDPLTCA
jgi:hypothetical protein